MTYLIWSKLLLITYLCLLWNNFVNGQELAEGSLMFNRLIPHTGHTQIIYDNEELDTGFPNCRRQPLPRLGTEIKRVQITKAYICANGLMKFDNRFYEPTPRNFGTYSDGREQTSGGQCLAPYWSAVDLEYFKNGFSKVFYKNYFTRADDPSVFERIDEAANLIKKITNYRSSWLSVATWINLRPKQPLNNNFHALNTFQLVLASNSKLEAVGVFLYENIDWAYGVDRARYQFFTQTSDLPVIGFNSGSRHPAEINRLYNFPTSGTVNAEEVDDEREPNTGKEGEIVLNLKTAVPPTSAEKCREWVNGQIDLGVRRSFCSSSCAPTLQLELFSLGSNFFTSIRTFKSGLSNNPNYCILKRQWFRTSADECCYTYFGDRFSFWLSIWFRSFNSFWIDEIPLQRYGPGHWHPYHPWFNPVEYQEEESRYQECCRNFDSTQESCSLFYSIRPICNSNFWFFPSIWGTLFGDPHFVTLDRKNYTFNGCGWYTYFTGNISGNNQSSLVVQVRTTRVGDVNATGFTAIAIKEGYSETIQVNLNASGALSLRVNKSEANLPSQNGTLLDSGISLSFENNTLEISTPLGSGVRIKAAANGTFFTFVVALLQEYKNSSLGLAGKWNDIIDDDFTLPNGTVLPIDSSESEIFYNFGEMWRVPQNEIIYEPVDDDSDAFKCPTNFAPIFLNEALDNLNESFRAEADKVCGSDVNCLFDIAATGDLLIGQSTLDESTTINNELGQIENGLPRFIRNISTINVTLGMNFTLVLQAVDPDDDAIDFDVPSRPNGSDFSKNATHLIFTWSVLSDEVVDITFVVTDTKNGTATLSPSIQLCKCENNGTCFVPEATSNELASSRPKFLIMSCTCQVGFIGQFCGEVRDFCIGEFGPTCNPLVRCFNSPTNFTCGPCPNGYSGNGQSCSDVDECQQGQSGCSQTCRNNAGSFECRCRTGYVLNSDGKTCDDIDECSRPNDCSQLCNNTIGSFKCGCRVAFVVDPQNDQNCIAQTECGSNNCNQTCYVDPTEGEKCQCRNGYTLGMDGESCNDIDECANPQSNLCSQRCQNTAGSYNCTCLPGYTLTDLTNCEDINECLTTQNLCPNMGQECENLPGGFRCRCSRRLNLVLVKGICVFQNGRVVVDGAPAPPNATNEQINNAVEIIIINFQTSNYTEEINDKFKEEVAKLLNAFCNENELRPQDCGVQQNSLMFNLLNVERLPGYPNNTGNNVTLRFYVDYPASIRNGTMERSTLGSILFTELQKLETALSLSLVVNTPLLDDVRPPPAAQLSNTVLLTISNFTTTLWTTLYDRIFRRAVAVSINRHCQTDNYTRSRVCLLPVSGSFQEGQISRIPGFPRPNGQGVDIEFYVNRTNSLQPLPRLTLASILAIVEAPLERVLSRNVEVRTSFTPLDPPLASSEQTANSIVIRIMYNTKWNDPIDRRLRADSLAPRISVYCALNREQCNIPTGTSTSFTVNDVQRTLNTTPTIVNDNQIDYSFYVNYPGQNISIAQQILASVVKIELDAIQSLSDLFFSIQTPFVLPTSSNITMLQSNNTVQIRILNQQADQWHVIQDNQFRAAIASQITSYCLNNLIICGLKSNQSFQSSQVIRTHASPTQNGVNSTYTFFVIYRDNSPVQRNLLAGILNIQLNRTERTTKLDLMVITSTLAAPATAATNNNTVIVSVIGQNADQWSAIQDNSFRGYVAAAISEFCANDSQCKDTGSQVNKTHVQIVQGSPRQNNANANTEFFVRYPDGQILERELLVAILNQSLASIESSTGLKLVILIEEPSLTHISIFTPTRTSIPLSSSTSSSLSLSSSSSPSESQSTSPSSLTPNSILIFPPLSSSSSTSLSVSLSPPTSLSLSVSLSSSSSPSPSVSLSESPIPSPSLSPSLSSSTSLSSSVSVSVSLSSSLSLSSSPFPSQSVSPSESPSPSSSISISPSLPTSSSLSPSQSTPKSILTFSPTSILISTPTSTPTPTSRSTPTPDREIVDNTVTVKLINFNASKWNEMLFQANMAEQINVFCFEEDICNASLPKGTNLTAENIKVLPGSPMEINATCANLSFYADIPDRNKLLPKNLLSTIFYEKRKEILAELPGVEVETPPVELPLENLTEAQRNNTVIVVLVVLDSDRNQINLLVIFEIRRAMVERMNTICFGSEGDVCQLQSNRRRRKRATNSRNFTLADITINSASGNGRAALDIGVNKPGTKDPVNKTVVQNALREPLQIRNFNLTLAPSSSTLTSAPSSSTLTSAPSSSTPTLAPSSSSPLSLAPLSSLTSIPSSPLLPTSAPPDDDDVDLPLILGLSIGGVLLLIFCFVALVYCKAKKDSRFKVPRVSPGSYGHSSWEFERDTPYGGTAFEGIRATSRYDEDGLPVDEDPRQ